MMYKIICTEAKNNIYGVDTYRVLKKTKEENMFGHRCTVWEGTSDKFFYSREEAEKELKGIKYGL